jgi:hypothetical protein
VFEPLSIVITNEVEGFASMIEHVTQPEVRIRPRHTVAARWRERNHGSMG